MRITCELPGTMLVKGIFTATPSGAESRGEMVKNRVHRAEAQAVGVMGVHGEGQKVLAARLETK